MESKHIGFILPNLGSGGAERVASLLTLYIKNYDKYLILFDGSSISHEFNAKLIDLHIPAKRNFIDKFFILVKRYWKLKRLKKTLPVSLYISFMETANVLNLLTKKINNKVIISIRNFNFLSDNFLHSQIYKFLIRRLYPIADIVHVVSRELEDRLKREFYIDSDKIKVIYNPYPIAKIVESSLQNLDIGFERIFEYPLIITTGRLTEAKGQWYLIRIFNSLKESFFNLKLVILGDGELRNYLINLAENLNLKVYSIWKNDQITDEYDVYFLGFQKNPFSFMRRSTLFVLPSLWEGFPNVLVEAMACRVPAVAADCKSGPREILAPDTDIFQKTDIPEYAKYGILMPVLDRKLKKPTDPITDKEKIWIESLRNLLKDKQSRNHYIEEGFKRAQDFDVSKIITQWEELIEGL